MQIVPLLLEGATNVRNHTELTEAGRQYATAYAAQYSERDLPAAFQLHMKVMASYPGAPEAEYSRIQVQNIVNTVVPKQELLDAEIKLALAHLEHEGPPDAERNPVGPTVAELSA
jgi:hypothetical protein